MNTSMDFDNCDDEIGPDNFMKRALEDAIENNRPISLGEYNAFMNSIGAMVPGFIVKSLPRLRFSSIRDCIKCTTHAIEFIRNHPSLPVSFSVKRGIQVLFDYLQRQETFLKIEESGIDVVEGTYLEIVQKYAKMGQIEILKIVLARHFLSIQSELDVLNQSIVSSVLSLIPITLSSIQFHDLLKECILLNIFEFSELAELSLQWARVSSDGLKLLDLLTAEETASTILQTPLSSIRSQVLKSERGEIVEMIEPLRFALEITHRYPKFGDLKLLEFNRTSALLDMARQMVEDLDEFKFFCSDMKIEKDSILLERIEFMLENRNLKKSKTDFTPISLRSLVDSIECIDKKAIAVFRILSLSDEPGWEELGEELLAKKISSDGTDLLRSHMLVISVQRRLCVFPDFLFLKERPDFFMKRSNVDFVVYTLCTTDRVKVAIELAQFFPYICVEECLMLWLALDGKKQEFDWDFFASFSIDPDIVSSLILSGGELDDSDLLLLKRIESSVYDQSVVLMKDFEKKRFSFWDLQDKFGPIYDRIEYGEKSWDGRFARLELVLGIQDILPDESEFDWKPNMRTTRLELERMESEMYTQLEKTGLESKILNDTVFYFLASLVEPAQVDDPIMMLSHIGETSVEDLTEFSDIHEFFKLSKLVERLDWLGGDEPILPSTSMGEEIVDDMEIKSMWAVKLSEMGILFSRSDFLNTKIGCKQIIQSILPELLLKSDFDLELAIKFSSDISGDNKFNERVEIEWLEQVLKKKSFTDKISTVLRRLEWRTISQFLIPRLNSNIQLEFVIGNCVTDGKLGDVVSSLIRLEELGAGSLSFNSIKDWKKLVFALLKNSNFEIVNESICLGGKIGLDIVNLIRQVLQFPENELCFILLIEQLLNSEEKEAVLCKILTMDGIESTKKRDLIKELKPKFVSEEDILFLNNRILLESSPEILNGFLERKKNLAEALKWVMESILKSSQNELLEKICDLNNIDLLKLRFEFVHKWLELETVSVDEICLVLNSVKELEKVALFMLKLIFSLSSLKSKLIAIESLYRLVPKKIIVFKYGNPICNLVQIEKNFRFFYYLQNNLKVKHLNYKEFTQMQKDILVKNLLQGSKLETLTICAMIVVDYQVFDFEIIESLESKLKSLSHAGAQIAAEMKNLLIKNSAYHKIVKHEDDVKAINSVSVNNENEILN